jgi:hypothetical protein
LGLTAAQRRENPSRHEVAPWGQRYENRLLSGPDADAPHRAADPARALRHHSADRPCDFGKPRQGDVELAAQARETSERGPANFDK